MSRSLRSNLNLAVASNLAIAVVSALTTLVLPKFMGVEAYGYWQLFVFYSSYVLLLQLGAGDGAQLRYAGEPWNRLAEHRIGSQSLVLCLVVLVSCSALFFAAPLLTEDESRAMVIRLAASFGVVANMRHFFVMVLQAASDFRAFGIITIVDRMGFGLGAVMVLTVGSGRFELLGWTEVLAKLSASAVALLFLHRAMSSRRISLRRGVRELFANCGVGIKLMIANTASMLILGVTRFLVDRAFGITVFGGLSLILNLSAFLMVFVNAVGMVLLPAMRRVEVSRMSQIFQTLRAPIAVLPLLFVLFAYPLQLVFSRWLPQYSSSVTLVPILLSIVVFESRMGLLVIPFLKTLRKENLLLVVNVVALAISVPIGLVAVNVCGRVDLAVIGLVFCLGLRMLVAEWSLVRQLKEPVDARLFGPAILVAASVLLHLTVGGWAATGCFAVLLALTILAVRGDLAASSRELARVLSPR